MNNGTLTNGLPANLTGEELAERWNE